MFRSPKVLLFIIVLFALTVFTLWFLATLRGGQPPAAPALGDQEMLGQGVNAVLICNEECLGRGQCGFLAEDDNPVVLLSLSEPRVANHDHYLPDRALVAIVGFDQRDLRQLGGEAAGSQFPMNFYLVNPIEAPGQGGWVAGWCVQEFQEN